MLRPTRMGLLLTAVWLVGCGGESSPSRTQTNDPASEVTLERVGDFSEPLYVAASPDDERRLYVVEQDGRVQVVRDGRKLDTPFLDISSQVLSGGERGLLGLAFPDSSDTGLFYVYYTGKDARQYLVEFSRSSPDRADPASARIVFAHDDSEDNHNGGQLQFGPDGFLYVGTGDGGGADDQHGPRGNAQSFESPLGKILRIDPVAPSGFAIPQDNPFVDQSGARGEIYSYGLRNPWRFSFDRDTGDLVIGDVGQDAIEEIDFVRAGAGKGANFGWRLFEGEFRKFPEPVPGHIGPVITHEHSDGWCSITGGYIIRDPELPELDGTYVYGDFCLGQIYGARLSDGEASDVGPLDLPKVENLSSFGEDAAGRVYVVSLSGPVYRLTKR